MDLEKVAAVIRARRDQDLMNGKKWWKEASDEQKRMLWDVLNKSYPNPVTEVMTRMAILAFEELLLDELDNAADKKTQ